MNPPPQIKFSYVYKTFGYDDIISFSLNSRARGQTLMQLAQEKTLFLNVAWEVGQTSR